MNESICTSCGIKEKKIERQKCENVQEPMKQY